MELGSVTLKRIGFFCFPIKHSTQTRVTVVRAGPGPRSRPFKFCRALAMARRRPGSHGHRVPSLYGGTEHYLTPQSNLKLERRRAGGGGQ